MNEYTAIIRQSGDLWIGWMVEVPGVICQEATREELLESLEGTLKEMLELNREDAMSDMDGDYQEVRITVPSGKQFDVQSELDRIEKLKAASTGLYKTDSEGNVIQSGYPHIVFKNTGAPMIEGTRIKVEVIAITHTSWGLGPKGIRREYPSLTLGEIHSALAYYWDHKEDIDQQIADGKAFAEEMRRQNEPHQRELMRKLVDRAKEQGIV